MTLARVRNPEALRYQAPGEWGAILGLDRCPEAKTLLDSLPTHDLEPLDPDAQVVNPVRRALEKTIRRVRSRLAAVRNRLVPAQQEPDPDTANRLEADAKALAGELDELKQQRVATSIHVRAGDLSEQDKLDALPVGGRLFMDVVRMIAYRAETRMMAPVIGAQTRL